MPYPHIPGIQFDIETTCEKCFYNPTAHSFHKMSENESEVYFYTCHARSKYYDDSEGFAKHMKLEIEKIKNKKWMWILDGAQFGFKHLCAPTFGMKVINALDSFYSIKLQKIIVINENTPFRIMLNAIWRYIPKYIQTKFVFDKNKMFSKLLKVDDKLHLLETKLTF